MSVCTVAKAGRDEFLADVEARTFADRTELKNNLYGIETGKQKRFATSEGGYVHIEGGPVSDGGIDVSAVVDVLCQPRAEYKWRVEL